MLFRSVNLRRARAAAIKVSPIMEPLGTLELRQVVLLRWLTIQDALQAVDLACHRDVNEEEFSNIFLTALKGVEQSQVLHLCRGDDDLSKLSKRVDFSARRVFAEIVQAVKRAPPQKEKDNSAPMGATVFDQGMAKPMASQSRGRSPFSPGGGSTSWRWLRPCRTVQHK